MKNQILMGIVFFSLSLQASLLDDVFGCSASLVQAIIGENKSPSDEKKAKKDDETILSQTLATVIYEYLAIGKPEVITNWIVALQVKYFISGCIKKLYVNLLTVEIIVKIKWGISIKKSCILLL